MHKRLNAVTLMELLVALILLSIIVLGIANIDIFSHFQVISSDRRAKIQNEASLVLEHMTKEINKAIGNEVINGDDSVVEEDEQISSDDALKIYIDTNGNGQREDPSLDIDRWIAYRFTGATGNPNTQYQIWFCPQCNNKPCVNCTPSWNPSPSSENVISAHIAAFNIIKPVNVSGQLNNNFVTVQLTACWDPTIAESVDNPCVNMNTNIKMPSVSTN